MLFPITQLLKLFLILVITNTGQISYRPLKSILQYVFLIDFSFLMKLWFTLLDCMFNDVSNVNIIVFYVLHAVAVWLVELGLFYLVFEVHVSHVGGCSWYSCHQYVHCEKEAVE